ncbi:MAG: DegT/DnrJ/EryC1/StrS family aminotransferase [Elusimicrobia bacterium]|nr:DegT/DnrJ/EryC1/StrS family aminotransferase [Elusimicrobiota bacterium]
MQKQITVTRSSMPDYKQYCKEIKELWKTHWLTNMGKKHKQFQKELEKFCNVPHIVLYTNGHLALENIIIAMNLKKGGEIITTPFTFVSTTHAIVRTGFKPVFCDINATDYTIDVKKIEKLITKKTVAIVPVHVYGNICNIEAIEKIAKKYKLKVIYDAAHTFGETYKGISTANFGDASIFSFHATKVFNTIEGGAVCFSNDKLVQVLNDMKNFGFRNSESVVYIGGNAKMNEFQAIMGICNLKLLKQEIKKRKKVFQYYRERLQNIKGIKLCEEQKNVEYNYGYFPVLFDDYKYTRDEIFEKLKAKSIMTRKYFYPLISDLECYKNLPMVKKHKTPVAKYISERILTLPLYADLSLRDVNKICDIILK